MKAVDYLFLVALLFVLLGAFSLVKPVVTGLAWCAIIVLVTYKVFAGEIQALKE